eukprot:5766401-Lingulodinium_polyedra.AAC.1
MNLLISTCLSGLGVFSSAPTPKRNACLRAAEGSFSIVLLDAALNTLDNHKFTTYMGTEVCGGPPNVEVPLWNFAPMVTAD